MSALSIYSWLNATSWSSELGPCWFVVTVVLTVYSLICWLEVSRMELLFVLAAAALFVFVLVPWVASVEEVRLTFDDV